MHGHLNVKNHKYITHSFLYTRKTRHCLIITNKRKNKHKQNISTTFKNTLSLLLTLNDDTGTTLGPVGTLF